MVPLRVWCLTLLVAAVHFFTSEAFKCPAKEGTFPHPELCGAFYRCDGDQEALMKCPPGLAFNRKIQVCDWPQNVKCTSNKGGNEDELTSLQPNQDDLSQRTEVPWTPAAPTMLVPPPTFKPFAPVEKNNFRVVCYFTNWAWYRPDKGKFRPENVNPFLCTHINYAFAVLDYESLTLKIYDSWADVDNRFYEQVIALKKKNPALKVLLSIGGWNDSTGDKYSRLVGSAVARARFVTEVVPLLRKYDFDGLDLDWEYPACVQGNCGGHSQDKDNFATFLQELRVAFDKEQLLLTAAVSAGKRTIDEAYNVPALSKYLDHMNIMTYDMHGAWEHQAGINAPLYYRQGDWIPEFNVNFSVNYWQELGANPKKLVVGVPLYGRGFTLSDPSQHNIGDPTSGPATAGSYTRESGFLAYYEICNNVKHNQWTKVVEPKVGVYAFKGDQWVGYDDTASVAAKARLVRDRGLGGLMVWALDLDDFAGDCCRVPSPLLTTISQHLLGYPDPGDLGCE